MTKKGRETISQKIIEQLKDLFLDGYTSPYDASLILKIDPMTASKYYAQFAKELEDNYNQEDWVDKEIRARIRAIEGLSREISKVRKFLKPFEIKLEQLLNQKDSKITTIVKIERIVRLNRKIVINLLDKFDALEMTPPNKIQLEKETEKRIRKKSQG